LAGQAFPLVVYCHKLENNERKIMDISECAIQPDGSRQYRQLYRYRIIKNTVQNGEYAIEGVFEQVNTPSESLQRRLMQYGIPQNILDRFMRKERIGA